MADPNSGFGRVSSFLDVGCHSTTDPATYSRPAETDVHSAFPNG